MKIQNFSSSFCKNTSPEVISLIEIAGKIASNYGLRNITSDFLLIGLLKNKESIITKAISSFANCDAIVEMILTSYIIDNKNSILQSNIVIAQSAQVVLDKALFIANNARIEPEHVLKSLFLTKSYSISYLHFFGISEQDLFIKIDQLKMEQEQNLQSSKNNSEDNSSKNSQDPIDKVKNIASQFTSVAKDIGSKIGNSTKTNATASSVIEAAASAVSTVSDAIKNATNQKLDKTLTRDEWISILDKAIELSHKMSISVPAAFVQVSMSSQSVVDRITRNQIRIDVLHDAVQNLLNSEKNS